MCAAQQVVTIQSRQYVKLPPEVQQRLFVPGAYTEMWPSGPDSVQDLGPRNIRIAYVEDQLLAIANDKPDHIQLIPERFDPAGEGRDVAGQHVLAICEGSRSRTLEYFAGKFGTGDSSMYALDGRQVQDMVLGLRVKSELPDPMAVLLTVAQNRFLLNSLHGEGFLNMRLTDQETSEAVGIDPVKRVFTECIQASPCLMELRADREFYCSAHQALFLPALVQRVGPVAAGAGRTAAVRRSAGEPHRGNRLPAGHGAAAALHRPAVSEDGDGAGDVRVPARRRGQRDSLLAGTRAQQRTGLGHLAGAVPVRRPGAATPLRDADFLRHEAVMAMLQYRHKSRAWRQMVTTDAAGDVRAIKDEIARGIAEGGRRAFDKKADLNTLMKLLVQIRSRLAPRLDGLPDDATLRAHLERIPGPMLHTLLVSEAWDTGNVGGEEVDVEWLLEASAAAAELT